MTKRALVTGSAGLIGRHMCVELDSRGFDVTAIDVHGWSSHLENSTPGIRHGSTDARDYFTDGHHDDYFDLVVHCAAHVGGRADIEGRPAYLAAVNSQLDGAMFEWALRAKPAHIIYWSSSAAYPVSLQGPMLESWSVIDGEVQTQPGARALRESDIDLDNPQQPDASYGAVKLMGEQMARWAESEGLRVHVMRPFSGYSDDQSPDYPFPSFIGRAKRRADPFDVWGSGEQVRDFVHVQDVVSGALAAVEQDYDKPLNLCSGVGTSFNQLATMVCDQAGYTPELRHHLDAPTGVHYRVGDPTEMLKVYTPRVTLDQGIKQALV